MIDSEYNPDNCMALKIRIRAVIKNPEMLKFVADHFSTKTGKNAVSKLLLVIKYVFNQFKTQEICDKVILESRGTF